MAFPEELGPAFFDTRNVSVGELGRKRGEGDLFVIAFLLSFFGKRDLFLIHYFLKAVLVISRDFVFENEHLSFSDFPFFEDGVGSLGEEVQIILHGLIKLVLIFFFKSLGFFFGFLEFSLQAPGVGIS